MTAAIYSRIDCKGGGNVGRLSGYLLVPLTKKSVQTVNSVAYIREIHFSNYAGRWKILDSNPGRSQRFLPSPKSSDYSCSLSGETVGA